MELFKVLGRGPVAHNPSCYSNFMFMLQQKVNLNLLGGQISGHLTIGIKIHAKRGEFTGEKKSKVEQGFWNFLGCYIWLRRRLGLQ